MLLRGCKCTTGCSTAWCSCRKGNRRCSEGCECKNCSNNEITVTQDTSVHEEILTAFEDEDNEDSGPEDIKDSVAWDIEAESEDEDINDIMHWVFGEEVEREN